MDRISTDIQYSIPECHFDARATHFVPKICFAISCIQFLIKKHQDDF
jgi:hypothetical protein